MYQLKARMQRWVKASAFLGMSAQTLCSSWLAVPFTPGQPISTPIRPVPWGGCGGAPPGRGVSFSFCGVSYIGASSKLNFTLEPGLTNHLISYFLSRRVCWAQLLTCRLGVLVLPRFSRSNTACARQAMVPRPQHTTQRLLATQASTLCSASTASMMTFPR